jgi:hypothetical protein
MDLNINIDERVADGIYWGTTLSLIKNLIENPKQLLTPANVTNEMLEKLKLKEYPPKKKIKKKNS